MYQDFYHLKENPFNITADPGFFFSSSRHIEAFAHLEYGIRQRKGIVVVTGEIGTGKTTLCRTLLNRLDQTVKTALVLNPDFSNTQLLQLILKDLGIQPKGRNRFSYIDALNNFLLLEASVGNNVVIIIDEAQNLSPRQLEQIRLLSNLETEKDKLLQIILVGQPELVEKLKLPELRQLNQRVAVRYHILPLDRQEMALYIEHRLKIASLPDTGGQNVYFTDDAIDLIYEISRGTPRTVNLVCDRALLAGFNQETFTISREVVLKSSREVVMQ